MPRQSELTTDEQKLNDIFDEHVRSEFLAHSADQTMETMVANPRINEIPVMIGGNGREEVYEFYAKHFLPHIPPDAEIVPVSRTIGQGRLVDEMIPVYSHGSNGLVAPRDRTDREACRDGISRHRAVQW